MTISSTTSRVSYSGNGVTTAFSFPHKFLDEDDLVVVLRETATGTETAQTITTNYTVTGAGVANGGTVTMLVAPASGYTLVIYGDPTLTQDLDLVENDSSPAEEIEERFDKLTLIGQRIKNITQRSIRLSDGFSPTFDPTLPTDLDLAADKVLTLNSDATGFADVDDWPTATDISEAGDNATAAAASATAAAASATAAVLAVASATYFWGGSAGGTANALTLTPTPAFSSYATGYRIAFKATATNTAAATVAVSGLSAITIKRQNGDALNASDIVNGGVYSLTYDGTNFLCHELSAGKVLGVTSKTTTYTATPADDLILCSASAFTVTLPAATNVGKIIRIQKTDSSFSNIITISRAGSDTIEGDTSTTLNTQYEIVTLVADGTSTWYILDRSYPQEWTSASMTIDGGVSNPTKGTVTETFLTRRVGSNLEMQYNLVQNVAGTAGSGNYLFTIPNSLTIDSAKTPISANQFESLVGLAHASANSDASSAIGYVAALNTTQLVLVIAEVIVGSGNYALDNGTVKYSFNASVAISGWKGK